MKQIARPPRASQHEQHAHLYQDRSARPASGGRVRPGSPAMSTASTITDYIEHNRSLGKRFRARQAILSRVHPIGRRRRRCTRSSPAMITRFVDRKGTSDTTKRKKYSRSGALLPIRGHARPVEGRRPCRASSGSVARPSFTPYIYSEAELKRLLAAVPAATGLDVPTSMPTRCARSVASVRCRTAPRRGSPPQTRGCRSSPIAAPHQGDEVLQDAHRPPRRRA